MIDEGGSLRLSDDASTTSAAVTATVATSPLQITKLLLSTVSSL
jgi:hypothetical protein